MHLQLFTVLSLLSLAIALPHPGYLVTSSPHLKRQYCPTTNTTTTQPWTLSEFRIFTADPGPDGISYVSFYFLDPNDGGLNLCGRSLPPGSGRSPIDPDTYYPCEQATVSFMYLGDSIDILQNLSCGNLTDEATGSADLSLTCETDQDGEDGTLCYTSHEVEVPVGRVVGLEKK